MKQVLSVADFGLILNLVNDEIKQTEQKVAFTMDIIPEEELERRLNKLKESPYYKSLMHLKGSLENLNIEVEIPDIEVKE